MPAPASRDGNATGGVTVVTCAWGVTDRTPSATPVCDLGYLIESLLQARINPSAPYFFLPLVPVTYNETNHGRRPQGPPAHSAHNAGDPPKLAKLGAVSGRLGGLDAGRGP